ncbi:MAG: poly(3-hydroxyalkanoate) depolymerase [Steroidobacterales bacterium]
MTSYSRTRVTVRSHATKRPAPPHGASSGPFTTQMLLINGQSIRVGRQAGSGTGMPLFLFNGIGGNIELLGPLAQRMPRRELITFDVPGVGHSELPGVPYRLPGLARMAASILDHFGHKQADIFGVSWGGTAAQEFALTCKERCHRLILCSTSAGAVMMPASPQVLWKMATPLRYMRRDYARQVAGDIYGGDFRKNPDLALELFRHVRWQSRLGYYLQIAAVMGWTSVHWLYRVKQPTLIMAGFDDPLVPILNAHILKSLIPHSELKVFNCGHLFLLTRADETVRVMNEFLDRPDMNGRQ